MLYVLICISTTSLPMYNYQQPLYLALHDVTMRSTHFRDRFLNESRDRSDLKIWSIFYHTLPLHIFNGNF